MATLVRKAPNKDTSLQARVTSERKRVIEQGAALLGMSVSDLLVFSAYEKATATIKDHEVLELSRRASEQFAEALISTEEPSEAFKKGSARYANMIKR
jgi:uncharacterized protein (DUF1778 family)